MTWFLVDDAFWSHPKVLHTSNEALGLWVRVGAYCARHQTDGRIDLATVHSVGFGRKTEINRAVTELLRVGLWIKTSDDVLEFHDWEHIQLTRAEREKRRAKDRERKRSQRRDAAGRYAP